MHFCTRSELKRHGIYMHNTRHSCDICTCLSRGGLQGIAPAVRGITLPSKSGLGSAAHSTVLQTGERGAKVGQPTRDPHISPSDSTLQCCKCLPYEGLWWRRDGSRQLPSTRFKASSWSGQMPNCAGKKYSIKAIMHLFNISLWDAQFPSSHHLLSTSPTV